MQANVETVRRMYDAMRARDVAAIFALLDEDVTFVQSEQLPWGGTYRGHAGAGAFMGKLVDAIDSTPEIERLIDAGDQVVAVGATRGTARGSGKSFTVPFVHVWTVHGGTLTRFEGYIDTPGMLAALDG